jgi:large subunit ribosomal protein L23
MPKEIHPYAVLREPIITEKSTELAEDGKYVFEVDPRANKLQIREAVEIAFGVRVRKVNVISVRGATRRIGRGRPGRERDWKKAIVTLHEGYEIRLFEGV